MVDQRRMRLGQQRVGRRKPGGCEDQARDLIARINARDATSLPIAKMVRRGQFVLEIFHAKVLSKVADDLVARVPLRERSGLAGPVDGCGGTGVRLLSSGSAVINAS